MGDAHAVEYVNPSIAGGVEVCLDKKAAAWRAPP